MQSNHVKYALTVLLLLASLIVLVFRLSPGSQVQESQIVDNGLPGQVFPALDNLVIPDELLALRNEEIEWDGYYAVFFLEATTCSSCFVELDEYIELIRQENAISRSEVIKPVGYLYGIDVAIFERWKKTARLDIPFKVGPKPSDYVLGSSGLGQESFPVQLILANRDQVITHRVMLPVNAVTPVEYKKRILSLTKKPTT